MCRKSVLLQDAQVEPGNILPHLPSSSAMAKYMMVKFITSVILGYLTHARKFWCGDRGFIPFLNRRSCWGEFVIIYNKLVHA